MIEGLVAGGGGGEGDVVIVGGEFEVVAEAGYFDAD